MCWVFYVVGKLDDTKITHAFKSVFLLLNTLLGGLVFACHQVLVLCSLGTWFSLDNCNLTQGYW